MNKKQLDAIEILEDFANKREKFARRFNENKNRLDLVPSVLVKEVGKIMTFGAKKYDPDNWRKGMPWSKCIASLERHLVAFKEGIDYDEESLELHLSHLATNAAFLLEYYHTHPELDDRQHKYLNEEKIGVDIDGVCADFIGHLLRTTGNEGHIVTWWNCPIVMREFNKVKDDPNFWASIPPLVSQEDFSFQPYCYITARSIDKEITQEWLNRHNFPVAPLYCVGHNQSKIEVAKESGVTRFIDDSYENFINLTKAGIFTYLFDAPYNRRYDVGFRRLYNLKL